MKKQHTFYSFGTVLIAALLFLVPSTTSDSRRQAEQVERKIERHNRQVQIINRELPQPDVEISDPGPPREPRQRNRKDSDSDGLTDKEEILIWKTDPRNADTDGDGFSDGDEVFDGENPLGPGRIYETLQDDGTTDCSVLSGSQELVCYINEHRKEHGKSSLTLDDRMSVSAGYHARWMREEGRLSHEDNLGRKPWDRCRDSGTQCDAENVAYNSHPSMKKFFDQWKNSPGHNTNMLGDHTEIGVGMYEGYAVTVFN